MTKKIPINELKLLNFSIKEMKERRKDLIREIQENCVHSLIEETYTSHEDDWDRTTTFFYERQCAHCGLVDRCNTFSSHYNSRTQEVKFLTLFGAATKVKKLSTPEIDELEPPRTRPKSKRNPRPITQNG